MNRMVLHFGTNGNGSSPGYHAVRRLPLAAVISPQFVRRREDKLVTPRDISIRQVTKVVDVPLADRDVREIALPKSLMLRREVYTKVAKGETMVRKFVMWKTNKETQSEDYPAYVVHFTDFSSNRKDPLSRDVRVSNSLEQIQSLWNELKESNIKKGWEAHSVWEESLAPKAADLARPEEPRSAASEPRGKDEAEVKPAAKKRATSKAPAERPTKLAAAKKTAGQEAAPAEPKTGGKMAPSERSTDKKTKAPRKKSG